MYLPRENIEEKVPLEEKNKAAYMFIERQKFLFLKNRDLTASLNKLRDNCTKEIHAVIGETKLEAYLNRHKETKEEIISIPIRYKTITESIQQEHDFRKGFVKNGQDFIKSLDIELEKTKNIHKSYIKNFDAVLQRCLEPREEALYAVIDFAEASKKTHNPWT